MDTSHLRRPTVRPIIGSPFYERGPEDPELSQAIWKGLFRLSEEDLMSLYFCDYSRLWELLELEKPEWWTGNFSCDARHDLYRRPINRFVDDCWRERPFFKHFHTHIQRLCTPEEFDQKWHNGEFYTLYSYWD